MEFIYLLLPSISLDIAGLPLLSSTTVSQLVCFIELLVCNYIYNYDYNYVSVLRANTYSKYLLSQLINVSFLTQ